MNREAKNIVDLPLCIEQYNEELKYILKTQTIHYENIIKKALKKREKMIPYPEKYGNISGKYNVDIKNTMNTRSIILTRENGKEDDRIEIELNAPIFLHIEPDLKSLNKILSDISRDIYIVHSNIINLYSYALDQSVESELEKSKLSIESFEKRRREIPEFNDLLNKSDYKRKHTGLNEEFKRLHGNYISVLRDIEYLKGLKTNYEREIARRLEMCNTIEQYVSQKLRIVYNGLMQTIANLNNSEGESVEPDGLIDFDYREYSLKFDKMNGRIYAARMNDDEEEVAGYDLIGELENYNIKQHVQKDNKTKIVSKFLVEKLLWKYLYLKRILGYHIRQDTNRPVGMGDLVSFVYEGSKYIGLVMSFTDSEYTVQTINTENINLMDDSEPILKFTIDKDEVVRVLPIREEILSIKKMKMTGLTYNYELYTNYTRRAGHQPEIPIPHYVKPVLLKNSLYPSLTIKTITKRVSKSIVRILKDRIPEMDRELNEPLNNITNVPTLSELIDDKNKHILQLISTLLAEDALTRNGVDNIEYVSNILDTLKRRERKKEEDDDISTTELLLGGGVENNIFDDFNILNETAPTSLDEFNGGNGEFLSEDSTDNSLNTYENSIDDVEQYGGMDVKNIVITEKNLKK